MADSVSADKEREQKSGRNTRFFSRLIREHPLGAIGGFITLALLFTGIFADFLAPYGMNETRVGPLMAPPSADFWFGTDNLGRDILSRIIYGARISMIIGLGATSLGTIVSTTIGMLCGYIGGRFDTIVQRLVDGVQCLPGLVLLMVLMSLVGPGMLTLILVMGIHGGIGGSRFPRSVVFSIKENTYLDAARAVGSPHSRVLIRHVLPNIIAPIIIGFSLSVPGVILGEAGLSFLGFGIPPPAPSWGGMLSGSGRQYMFRAPWMALFPGLALSIVVFGINMFGDAVRDILDPRLRGGLGRFGLERRKMFSGMSENNEQSAGSKGNSVESDQSLKTDPDPPVG